MDSPAFGQADLSNCERELIHLAGSVQPHGALLLQGTDLRVLQASANCRAVLGTDVQALLGQPLAAVSTAFAHLAAQVTAQLPLLGIEPLPLKCTLGKGRALEGTLHRPPGGGLIIELEPAHKAQPGDRAAHLEGAALSSHIAAAVQRFTATASIQSLADATVQVLRDLTGYDRLMVYRFDADGHGKIIAEARDPRQIGRAHV